MRKFSKYILFLILSLCSITTYAQREQILNFTSDIIVNKDASIDVTENITVHANQDRIIRGIVRRMPTNYVDSYGIKHHTNYQLQQVLIDGKQSPYHTEFSNNQFAIYIGKLDVMLPPGNYTYTISYHVRNAINFLSDADELYWNITGNEWDFPILKAEANITLPSGADATYMNAYTGKMGAKEKDFLLNIVNPNQIKIDSTRELSPGEGLTIAVAWPKGFVIAPTWKQQIKSNLEENRGDIIALEILAALLIYFLVAWFYYGRDPRKGTIIPLFEPPENLSPATIRYIHNMGVDAKTFTTGIVSMATKNALTIDNKQGVFTLFEKDKDATLSLEEKISLHYLFKDGDSLTLAPSESTAIQSAQSHFFRSISEQYHNVFFNTNYIFLLPAPILSLLALISTISTYTSDIRKNLVALLVLAVMLGVSTYLINSTWPLLRNAFRYPSFTTIKDAGASGIFAVVFSFITLSALGGMAYSLSIFTIAVLLLLIAINLIFRKLLKAPTLEGRKVMDQIEGFRLFLSTTEGYRLDQFMKGKDFSVLFEKYLPYAIALDVENEWGEKFNSLLERAGMETKRYQPNWYTGAVWTGVTAATFPQFLNTGLYAAVISSVSASSSASGGGGSSGGGGGGGGGGGW